MKVGGHYLGWGFLLPVVMSLNTWVQFHTSELSSEFYFGPLVIRASLFCPLQVLDTCNGVSAAGTYPCGSAKGMRQFLFRMPG
jgi:hypothetical protein